MRNPPLTTGHSHWQAARDVRAGQYFKDSNRWHLAITDAVRATGEWAHLYAWVIRAYGTDGHDHWVGVLKSTLRETEVVEVSNAGRRPGPFTPATLRRKAQAHREAAIREMDALTRKETLARRLEEGSVLG
jgi:hypothetical protein